MSVWLDLSIVSGNREMATFGTRNGVLACLALSASLGMLAPAAFAQDTAPPAPAAPTAPPAKFQKVTPKRLGVPKPGTRKLITIQIRPEDIARQKGLDPVQGAPISGLSNSDTPQPANLQDWFWNGFAHDTANAGPERFSQALTALAAADAPTITAPSFQNVTDLARAHGTDLLLHSIGTRVSPALALAVISVESAGKSDAVSSAGAQGLMQLIPATAERFGVKNTMDPSENIRGGIAYIDWLLKHFNNDAVLALAAYNAGENAVSKYKGAPPFPETRLYVPKVLAAWNVARRLCITPPELPSDGCVFATNALKAETKATNDTD